MKKSRRALVILACALVLCVVGLLAAVAKNQMAAGFDELSETDQTVLSEYNTLCESLSENDVWEMALGSRTRPSSPSRGTGATAT